MTLEASIIIPTYNKRRYLAQVLATLAEQLDDRFEIVVADDGSTDDTRDIAQRFGTVYIKQEHKGFGLVRARNTGARAASSDFFVFLDDDLKVCPNYLQKVLEAKSQYGDRAVQAGYIWDYTGRGDPDIRTQWGVWERPGIPTKRFYHVNGGNFAIYKSLYWQAGGNQEYLVHGGIEDILFGYLISLVPDTFVVYNRDLKTHHLPHPKTWGRSDEMANWELVRVRYPALYEDYVIRSIR